VNLPAGWRFSGPFRSNAGFREALAAGRDEAASRNHRMIRPAHILAGILRSPDARVVAALADLGILVSDLTAAIATEVGPSLSANARGPDLPYTRHGVAVLHGAVRAAERLRHDWLGAVHLLAALSQESWGAAPRVLHTAGVSPSRLWPAIERIAARMPPPPSSDPPLRLPVQDLE